VLLSHFAEHRLGRGWLLHRVGSWLFSSKTFTTILEPVLSDMQVEIFEALAAKQPRKARWVQIRGYSEDRAPRAREEFGDDDAGV
jgi:hypothetical protein